MNLVIAESKFVDVFWVWTLKSFNFTKRFKTKLRTLFKINSVPNLFAMNNKLSQNTLNHNSMTIVLFIIKEILNQQIANK